MVVIVCAYNLMVVIECACKPYGRHRMYLQLYGSHRVCLRPYGSRRVRMQLYGSHRECL